MHQERLSPLTEQADSTWLRLAMWWMGSLPVTTIAVFHDNQWKNVTVDVVGIGEADVDVAVLSCPTQLAPTHPLEASFAGLTYGQTVYFLGFPFGWDSGAENINRDFPMPFVKTGIISALIFGNPTHFFIDGHGNKGFSGGPVVFVPNGQPQTELRVAGIVCKLPDAITRAYRR